MVKVYFKKTTKDSFFGDFLYEMVIPENHFLVKLKTEIPWDSFIPQLLPYYKGAGEYGSPAFNPVLILKMLFLSYLYNLSEREVEEFANFNLPAKYFLGMGVDQHAPDHATLSVFNSRLIKRAGVLPFEQIFTKVVKIALDKGIKFGNVQVVDSSHVPANVNIIKDKIRRGKGKPPRDKDAKWGVKHMKEARTKEGRKIQVREEFYGFKTHTSLNTKTGITTSVKATSGEVFDGQLFGSLVNKDKQKGIMPKIYSADKAYDDGENHLLLAGKQLGDAIKLKENRTTTKNSQNNLFWQKLKDNSDYKEGLTRRYLVERSYADGKIKHGLKRCRYTGLIKFSIQNYLTFTAMNLKRIIKLICNISFRNESYTYSYAYS